MNRKEFLEQLSNELTKKGVQDISDIISDFDDHFHEATQSGQTEAAICQMLGDPAEIAQQCVEEFIFTDTQLQKQEGTAEILVNLRTANLVLEPGLSDDFEVRIERRGLTIEHDPDQFSIEQNSDYLHVTQQKNSIVSWLFGFLEIQTVIIAVPRRFFGNIQIKMISGSLKQSGPMNITHFQSEVTSGSTRLNGLSSESIELQSLSGSIKLEQCVGEVTAKGFTGGISVNAHRGNVNAESTSGSITIETDQINKNAVIGTKSGSLKLHLEKLAADLQLRCISGSIRFTIMELYGNVNAKCTTGSITGHFKSDTKADFRLKSSGVKNEFAENSTLAGIPCVTLSSLTGFVRIKKI